MKSSVQTPNQQTNHTLSWMSFGGLDLQAPKVPQDYFHGTCSRALLAKLIQWRRRRERSGMSTWQGFSICACHPKSVWRRQIHSSFFIFMFIEGSLYCTFLQVSDITCCEQGRSLEMEERTTEAFDPLMKFQICKNEVEPRLWFVQP